MVKVCRLCLTEKPVEEFYFRKDKPEARCKKCTNMKNNEWSHNRYHGDAEYRARRTAGTLERRKANRDAIYSLKEASPCGDCGVFYPYYVMDFDHRPDERKFLPVSIMLRQGYTRLGRLKEEIAKCDLVCANCHRIRTFTRIEKGKPTAKRELRGR